MFVRCCELPSVVRSCTFGSLSASKHLITSCTRSKLEQLQPEPASLLTVSQCESLQIFSVSRRSASLINGLCECLSCECARLCAQCISSLADDGRRDFTPPPPNSLPLPTCGTPRIKMCWHSRSIALNVLL